MEHGKRIKDVECCLCSQNYYRVFDDEKHNSIGECCASFFNFQNNKGGFEAELGANPSLESVGEGELYISCGYGSYYDMDSFKFISNDIEKWKTLANKYPIKSICDNCLYNMILSKDIHYACSNNGSSPTYPSYCDRCDILYRKIYECQLIIKNRFDDLIISTTNEDPKKDNKYEHVYINNYVNYNELPKWYKRHNIICNKCIEDLLESNEIDIYNYERNFKPVKCNKCLNIFDKKHHKCEIFKSTYEDVQILGAQLGENYTSYKYYIQELPSWFNTGSICNECVLDLISSNLLVKYIYIAPPTLVECNNCHSLVDINYSANTGHIATYKQKFYIEHIICDYSFTNLIKTDSLKEGKICDNCISNLLLENIIIRDNDDLNSSSDGN